MIKIALVDDNSINQKYFGEKIAVFGDIALLFVSNSGDEFLAKMKGLPMQNWPQVVFMDIQMPVQFDTYVYVMKVRYYNNVEKDFTGTIAVMK